MSRLTLFALAALSMGCATGETTIDAPAAAGASLPTLSVDVGGGCDSSLETRPNNACDGEAVLGLDLVAFRDASGDGLWSAGEVLEVDLELFAVLDDPDAWVVYPGVFAHLPDSVERRSGGEAEEITWFYGVSPREPQPLTVRLVAETDVAPGTQLVFTVGSLNCEGNASWGPCPTPSPLTLTIGG